MSTYKTEHTYENKDGTPFNGAMRYIDIDDITVCVECIHDGTVVASRGSNATAVRKELIRDDALNRDCIVIKDIQSGISSITYTIGTPVQPPARGTTNNNQTEN